jgi:multidrug efflux pump subunit AcrB
VTTAIARKSHAPKVSAKVRERKAVTERTAEIILGFFPDVNSGARAAHKYFAKFLTIVSLVGFLALLGINTLLAQDAFTLSNLKLEAKQVADQRDAITRSIDSYAAPENLAALATELGMRPSETPVFLDLTAANESGVSRG